MSEIKYIYLSLNVLNTFTQMKQILFQLSSVNSLQWSLSKHHYYYSTFALYLFYKFYSDVLKTITKNRGHHLFIETVLMTLKFIDAITNRDCGNLNHLTIIDLIILDNNWNDNENSDSKSSGCAVCEGEDWSLWCGRKRVGGSWLNSLGRGYSGSWSRRDLNGYPVPMNLCRCVDFWPQKESKLRQFNGLDILGRG